MLTLLDKGIAGFVSKSADTEILEAAIVLAGGSYLPPHLVTIAASQIHRGEVPVRNLSTSVIDRLTLRQHGVLRLVADGRTNKEIGRQLGIAPSTVKTHLKQTMRTLGAANRTETVRPHMSPAF